MSCEGAPDRLLQARDVVAVHGADVGDAEVLEQSAGLGEVDHRSAQPDATIRRPRAQSRDAPHGIVVGTPGAAPRARQLDARQVAAHRADRGRDAHLVVVEQDEQPRASLTEVVERLERQAGHQRRITDDDRDPLLGAADVARQREPLPMEMPVPA